MLHGPLNSGGRNLGGISDEPTDPGCCARCRRGTKALPGPCGYNGACPNNCHALPSSVALPARIPRASGWYEQE